MARRKELKGIASGVLSSFNSRNNDLYGYWGIGILCLYAQRLNITTLTIDLIDKTISPSQPSAMPMICFYNQMLMSKLESRGIPTTLVKSALLSISFNVEYDAKYHYFRSELGKPYLCSLSIVGDHDKVYLAVTGGRCRPHEPGNELMSTRGY